MSAKNYPGPTIMPPGGTLIYSKDNERVEGYTRKELIDRLTELREANHKRVGNPAHDIDSYLKLHNYSAPIPAKATQPQPRRQLTLIERVNAWVMTRYAKLSTLIYVNSTEAHRRATICVACPKNKAWKGCVTCSAGAIREVERNVILISQNKRTKLNDRLKACSVAGHENRVAVFLQPEFLAHRIRFKDELPSACWMKEL